MRCKRIKKQSCANLVHLLMRYKCIMIRIKMTWFHFLRSFDRLSGLARLLLCMQDEIALGNSNFIRKSVVKIRNNCLLIRNGFAWSKPAYFNAINIHIDTFMRNTCKSIRMITNENMLNRLPGYYGSGNFIGDFVFESWYSHLHSVQMKTQCEHSRTGINQKHTVMMTASTMATFR